MKKILLPSMFIIALTGSAFTRFSGSSHAGMIANYPADYNTTCASWDVNDYNCVPEEEDYICMELTQDDGWQAMYQYSFGSTCVQPYYSYWQNGPGN